MWQIEFTDEFGQWWDKLTENEHLKQLTEEGLI